MVAMEQYNKARHGKWPHHTVVEIDEHKNVRLSDGSFINRGDDVLKEGDTVAVCGAAWARVPRYYPMRTPVLTWETEYEDCPAPEHTIRVIEMPHVQQVGFIVLRGRAPNAIPIAKFRVAKEIVDQAMGRENRLPLSEGLEEQVSKKITVSSVKKVEQ